MPRLTSLTITFSFTSIAKIAHAGIKRQGYTSGWEVVRFSAAPPGLDILPGYALIVAQPVRMECSVPELASGNQVA